MNIFIVSFQRRRNLYTKSLLITAESIEDTTKKWNIIQKENDDCLTQN